MTKEELKEKASIEELKFYRDFWKQYIELEKLFLETEKYVAISEKNKNTFSIQYNILLQAICAEVDVVIKRVCLEYNNKEKPNNMSDYIRIITTNDPYFSNAEIIIELYGMKIYPWKNIGFRNDNDKEQVNCPYWWDGYIKIKHRRLTFSKDEENFIIKERNIQQANQKNVLGALAGLFALEIKCLEKMRERFKNLFQQYGLSGESVELHDQFNDSFFQKSLDIAEIL